MWLFIYTLIYHILEPILINDQTLVLVFCTGILDAIPYNRQKYIDFFLTTASKKNNMMDIHIYLRTSSQQREQYTPAENLKCLCTKYDRDLIYTSITDTLD